MGPKARVSPANDVSRLTLLEQINRKHPLVKLADLIGGSVLTRSVLATFLLNVAGQPLHLG